MLRECGMRDQGIGRFLDFRLVGHCYWVTILNRGFLGWGSWGIGRFKIWGLIYFGILDSGIEGFGDWGFMGLGD